jgi:hypothetical protein
MATELRKRVTRVTSINGRRYMVSIDVGGLVIREYRCRRELLLPFPVALTRAAWLAGDKKRKVKRSAI